MSSPFAGAEMITFWAPAAWCLPASSAEVNRPVDSITTSTPRSAQGSAAGSFSARILIVLPCTEMPSPVTSTSCGSRPSTLSYCSRCAIVRTSPRSFAATISMSWPSASAARQKLRPMRPKPFTPTRVVTPDLLEALPEKGGVVAESDPNGCRLGRRRRAGWAGAALRGEHLRGDVGLGVRDAELGGPPVGKRQQPADPAGDRVLRHRRVGELAQLLQRRLLVLQPQPDRKSTRLNSSHEWISYAVFCLKKKKGWGVDDGWKILRRICVLEGG